MPGEHRIFPPEAYHWGWWLVVAVAVAGAIAVGGWLWWTLRALRPAATGPDDLSALRLRAHADVDQVVADVTAGRIAASVAQQRLSATVRRFAGIAANADADYQVAPALRRAAVKDPRLQPVADFVDWIAPAAYADSDQPDVPAAVLRAREVIDGWV